MPSIPDPLLPAELFRPIIQYLADDRQTLCAISVTCRMLQQEGQRGLYKKMTHSINVDIHNTLVGSVAFVLVHFVFIHSYTLPFLRVRMCYRSSISPAVRSYLFVRPMHCIPRLHALLAGPSSAYPRTNPSGSLALPRSPSAHHTACQTKFHSREYLCWCAGDGRNGSPLIPAGGVEELTVGGSGYQGVRCCVCSCKGRVHIVGCGELASDTQRGR